MTQKLLKKEVDIQELLAKEVAITNDVEHWKGIETYLHAATSLNTRKAYQQDIRHFIQWGGLLPASPEMLLQYLKCYAATLKPHTLSRRLTAIKHWHLYQNFVDPTSSPLVRKLLTGITKTHGQPQVRAQPLSIEQLSKMVERLDTLKAIDIRDSALLQIGFMGAFRRSELVNIHWEDITFHPEGLTILIKRSKTDQLGQGQICAIPNGNQILCAVNVLKKWQNQSNGIGPVFKGIDKAGNLKFTALTPLSINFIIKRIASRCHFPQPENYSGHSLRRGFASEAAKNSIHITAIMRQGRWRHEKTVHKYIEESQLFASTHPINLILKN